MAEEKKVFRRLSELSLIDDYLFGLFIQEAGNEKILKRLVECMLSKKIKSIRIKHRQHDIANEPNLHGIRLDAYLVDDENTLYNIEVQIINHKDIAKRIRYQLSLIDREQMPSGTYDYNLLPKTVIIFVTDFDPFDKGLYRYTFKNICVEDKELLLNDETEKIILNTRGTDSTGVSEELIELLKYFRNSSAETVNSTSSKLIKDIDTLLEPIKNSPKFGGDFMSYQEKIYFERNEAMEIGIQRGRQEGRQEGRKEGMQKGAEKQKLKMIEQMRKCGITEEQIRKILEQ